MAKNKNKKEDTEEDMDREDSGKDDQDRAEGEGEEGQEGEESGKKSKLPLIVAGVVVLLLVVGAGLFFTGMLDGVLGKTPEHAEGEAGGEHAAAAGGDHGKKKGAEGGHGAEGEAGGAELFVVIPSMIVNLSGEDGVSRYLRLSVQLELEDPADKAAVEAIIPRVVDQFQTYLRELRIKDLRGSAGIYRLQMELLWRVNQAAAPVKIKDILFQEILIQ